MCAYGYLINVFIVITYPSLHAAKPSKCHQNESEDVACLRRPLHTYAKIIECKRMCIPVGPSGLCLHSMNQRLLNGSADIRSRQSLLRSEIKLLVRYITTMYLNSCAWTRILCDEIINLD